MTASQRLAKLEARRPRTQEPLSAATLGRLEATLRVVAAYHLGGWRPGDDVEAAFERVLDAADAEYVARFPHCRRPNLSGSLGDEIITPLFGTGDAQTANIIRLWRELPRERYQARDVLEATIDVRDMFGEK